MSPVRPLVVAALLAAAACTPKSESPVEVGEHKLDLKTLGMRTAQLRLVRAATTQGEALAGVVEGWVADAVLQQAGEGLTRSELIQERARIENDKNFARLYREVSRIYGEDNAAFLDVGLLPDVSLRKASKRFRDDADFNEKAERMAAATLRQAQDAPGEFENIAKAVGAQLREVTLDATGAVYDSAGASLALFSPNPSVEQSSAKRVLDIAQISKPGAVLGLVLRTADGELLVKRLDDRDGRLHLLTALVPKANFGEWLKAQSDALAARGDFKVCIHDEELRRQYEAAAKLSLLRCPK